MGARAGQLRYFADESILGVGKALEILRHDTVHPGHRLVPGVPLGTLDRDWMPVVAGQGLVVLGRDKRLRTRPGERELFAEHGLRVVRVGGKRDLSNWEMMLRFMRYWSDLEARIEQLGAGPWFISLEQSGIREHKLFDAPESDPS